MSAVFAPITDPGRLAAELQQHLVILQRITSALGEAITFDDIGEVVTADVAPTVGATRSALVIGGQLIALRGITTPDDTTVIASALDHAPAVWASRVELPPELGWVGGSLAAVLPLELAGRRIDRKSTR